MSDNNPPAADDSTVLVDDLVVRFDEVVAAGGVSFAVRAGEVSFAVRAGESFRLLGPNGAGKTTTVRVLTTLLRASEGRALVAGYDVRRNGLEVRASIGCIPQALSADGALTARENLEFYSRVTSVPRRVREERIAEIARVNPLTYEVQGLRQMLLGVGGRGEVRLDFLVERGFFAAMVAAATKAYPRAIL